MRTVCVTEGGQDITLLISEFFKLGRRTEVSPGFDVIEIPSTSKKALSQVFVTTFIVILHVLLS